MKNMESLKEKLLALIKNNHEISFVEYRDFLIENGIEYKGNNSIGSPKYENLIFWANISNEALDIIEELFNEKKINFVKTGGIYLLYRWRNFKSTNS